MVIFFPPLLLASVNSWDWAPWLLQVRDGPHSPYAHPINPLPCAWRKDQHLALTPLFLTAEFTLNLHDLLDFWLLWTIKFPSCLIQFELGFQWFAPVAPSGGGSFTHRPGYKRSFDGLLVYGPSSVAFYGYGMQFQLNNRGMPWLPG